MVDLVIIGAGIAGLTAAIYAKRAGLDIILLENGPTGGALMQTETINNYPGLPGISGAELTQKVYSQVKNLGVKAVSAKVLEIKTDPIAAGSSATQANPNLGTSINTQKAQYFDTSINAQKAQYLDVSSNASTHPRPTFTIVTDDKTYHAKAIVIAVGSQPKKMELEKESELTGHGVSYCATCDGSLYKNKPVAVVGGGNSALYEALYLAGIASQVYIIHRRNEFRGDSVLVDQLKSHDNVEFITEAQPAMLVGEQKVEALTVMLNDGRTKVLEVDAVFVAIGKEPATTEFANLLNLDDSGYIIAGEDCQTSQTGIWAAGDCRTKSLRQIITAAADGAISASAAAQYLKS